MTFNSNKLMNCYAKADISVSGVYHIDQDQWETSTLRTTGKDVCGFLVPLRGEAKYVIDEETFHVSPGTILHCGPGMTLEKTLLGQEPLSYILIHYKVTGDLAALKCLRKSLYSVSICAIQNKRIERIVNELLATHNKAGRGSLLRQKVLLYQFIEGLLTACTAAPIVRDKDKIQYIQTYIDQNLSEGLNVEGLAQELGMDPKAFAYIFTKEIGLSPKKYLTLKMMKTAESLLMETDLSINEIAGSVGVDDPLYFSRLFKKHHDYAPTEFRKQLGKKSIKH